MPKQAYYAARAIDERLQAQAATDPRAAAVHLEMSARYEALASDPDLELPPGVLTSADAPTQALHGSERPILGSRPTRRSRAASRAASSISAATAPSE